MPKRRREMGISEIAELPSGYVSDGMTIGTKARYTLVRDRTILLLTNNGQSPEAIAASTGLTVETVRAVLRDNKK
jgi:hypothetical protein